MYKVGTGENGTIAGKVYLFSQLEKGTAGCWTYCRGKLYLRRSGEELGVIQVICPETFQKLETVKLPCNEVFKGSTTANLNRNFPLLSDGENLFAIVMTFKKVKRSLKESMKAEFEELKKVEEAAKLTSVKKVLRKEQNAKSHLPEEAKICEFNLVEFDLAEYQGESDKPAEFSEVSLVEELIEGFSGYFSQKECLKALRMHSGNIEAASKWLLEEGENERGQIVVKSKRWILLGQSLVKEGKDTEVVEDSVLNPNVITAGQWTMNGSQITFHMNSSVAKVFSTKESDIKVLEIKERRGVKQLPVLSNDNDENEEESDGGEERERWKQQMEQQSEIVKKFYNEVELKGSLICTLTPEPLNYDRCVFTYSSSKHRFYVISFETSVIVTLLEYGNFKEINLSTMPEVLRKEFEMQGKVPSSPSELASSLLHFLKKAEGYRYSLPWKWNRWETLYQKMHEVLTSRLRNMNPEDADYKKKLSKLTKLKQRADNYKELQQNDFFKTLEINNVLEIPADKLSSAIVPLRSSEKLSYRNDGRDILISSNAGYGAIESIRFAKEAKKVNYFARYEESSTFAPILREPSLRPQEEKQEVQTVVENLKEPAFCSAGSWIALKFIMKGIRRQDSSLLSYYDQLLIWSLHCGVLSNYPKIGKPELINELSNHLISILKGETNHKLYKDQVHNYAWRILMIGWQLFITNAELQSFMFQQALKFPLGKPSADSYHHVMLSPSSTPFELFYCKHFRYQASFYSDHPLRQPHVQVYQLVSRISETDFAEKKGKLKNKIEFIEITGDNHNKTIEKYQSEEYLPKIASLLLLTCEDTEDFNLSDSNITVEQRIRYYTSGVISENKEDNKVLLEKLRADQNSRVEENWKHIQNMVVSGISTESSLFSWLVYNRLVFECLPYLQNKTETIVIMIKKFIENIKILTNKARDSTKNYKQIQDYQAIWLDQLYEHLFWIANFLYALEIDKKFTIDLVQSLLELLKVVSDISKDILDPLLLEACKYTNSESIDYLRAKIFETSHPYGRRESSRNETFTFPGAIAISFEFDKKSYSENSNDTLIIQTDDSTHNIYENFPTTQRFSGKCNEQQLCLLLGDTVSVSFQVNSQIQKLDPTTRWGFKVIFRPIYGESEIETIKTTNKSNMKLLKTVQLLMKCVAKSLKELIKGEKETPEEEECKGFFELSLAKNGLKLSKQPTLIQKKSSEEDISKKEAKKNTKKKYKLNTKVIEQPILKALDSNEGWLGDLIAKIRTSVKYPNLYEIEKKHESFTQNQQLQWLKTEQVCALCLLYHMGYTITEAGVEINDEKTDKIGQALNEILRWMLKRLVGLKEYYHSKLMFLEECAKCYEKCKEKIQEENKEKAKTDEEAAKPPKEQIKKIKKSKVVKTISKKKKLIISSATQEPPPKEKAKSEIIVIKISELPLSKKTELKGKMYDRVYESFTQRYQGNVDLLKSLAETVDVPYSSKDHVDIQRKVFIKLQESLKNIVNLESAETLPDEIPNKLNEKSPYETICVQVMKRANFLLELHQTNEKLIKQEESDDIDTKSDKSRKESEEDSFNELSLKKSISLQPIMKKSQTDDQVKKAVDDYFKWKRAKISEEEQPIVDATTQSIIAVITSNYSPKKIRKVFKLQEKCGLMRELGLNHFLELVNNHGLNMHVVGNITENISNGPFSCIKGCGPALTKSISGSATKLGIEIINTLIDKINKFDIDRINTKEKEIQLVGKEILYLLTDFNVLLKESSKANIIKRIYESSAKTNMETFLSKILVVNRLSQESLIQLAYPPSLTLLSLYIEKSCSIILGNLMEYATGKPPLQNAILTAILSSLEVKTINEVIESLLITLYDALIVFDLKMVSSEMLGKCAAVLQSLFESTIVPCVLNRILKCCRLIYKSFSADEFINQSIQKIGKIVLIESAQRKDIPEDREYYLLLHLNSNEDNPIFVLNALYHLENVCPSFTVNYPKDFTEEEKKGRETLFKGPFENTSLFIEELEVKQIIQTGRRSTHQSVLTNITKQFDEIVKLTQENVKQEDSHDEKLRKLNEKNFNERIQQHLKDTKVIYTTLSTRSFVQFPLAMSHKKALEVADIFIKAYNKQLDNMPINPYMKEDSKQKKLSTGLSVAESYPLTPKQPKNSSDSSYALAPPIIIAKDRLVASLCEKNTFNNYFTHNTKSKSKKVLDRVKYIHINQSESTVGASYSLCIATIVNFLRRLACINADARWKTGIAKYVNQGLSLLTNSPWATLNEEVKTKSIGSLILISGWLNYIRPGANVEAVVNNSKEACTIVSGGFGTGSQNVNVVIRNDDSLSVHSIPLECIKSTEENELYELVEEEALTKTLLSIHSQCDKNGEEIFSPHAIRLLLLKIAINMKWKKGSKELVDVLVELAKNNSCEIIKRTSEDKLAEAWEKLIEKNDASQYLFFVPCIDESLKKEDVKVEIGKLGKPRDPFEYVQPVSSYKKSLPSKKTNSRSETDSALKLLDYWEKNIIPAIQRMVKGAYKPWERIYYFEQLRDRLRKNDIDKAMEEALVICDQQLPGDCILPKDNRNWSAFVTEECIVGTWANAKMNINVNNPNPILAKLAEMRLNEIPVLIKAVNWQIQAAFCEYKDPNTTKSMIFLIPIDSLHEQERPLSLPVSVRSNLELIQNFAQNLKDLTASFALRTFVAMYNSCHLVTKSLTDIIHWVVMDELRDRNVEGWMDYAKPILKLPFTHKQEEDKSPIIRALKETNYLNSFQENDDKLTRLEEQICRLQSVELESLQKWCIETWQKLADLQSTVLINLSQTAEAAANDKSLTRGNDGNIIFPLHKLVSEEADNGACVITFELSAFLSANSKLKFFSDSLGQCLVAQMSAGKTRIQLLTPLVMNYGKVWCHFHQGTVANLSSEMQEKETPSSLPCCVTFIPALWTTACWLAEYLTTMLLDKATIKVVDSFHKPLIKSICGFVQKDTVPSILKQLACALINRIIRKMRYIYKMNPSVPGNCLEKLGLDKEWLLMLVNEMIKLKENEDIGEETTYSEFIQNASELIASALLPFEDDKSDSQKIVEQLRLPDWIRAVINVAIFLNYFKKEGKLTSELSQDIFYSLLLSNQEENIVLIKNLPKELSCLQIKQKLIQIFIETKVRIVNPETDIIISADSAIIITDGFDLNYSDIKEEKSPSESPERKVEEETKEAVTELICPCCTYINAPNALNCELCGSLIPLELPKPKPTEPIARAPLRSQEQEIGINEMWEKLAERIRSINADTVNDDVKKAEEVSKDEIKEKISPSEAKIEDKKKEQTEHKEEKVKESNSEPQPELVRSSMLFKSPLNSLLIETLRNRLYEPSKNDFLPVVKEILGKMFEKMKASEGELLTPQDQPEYTSAGIEKTKVTIKSLEEFVQNMRKITDTSPLLVWQLLAYYGYDLWLEKSSYFSQKELPSIFDTGLLEDMITMCEVEICKETKVIMNMGPTYLRLTAIGKDALPMINGLDEQRLRMRYAALLSNSLDSLRYNWGILKKFNDYLMKAVPYINWSMCVNIIPDNSIPLTASSFLSSFRKLCLGYVKMKLQQVVFDKTAVEREGPPKLVFERLKFGNKKQIITESMFYRAYEQMKTVDLLLLRPQKPEGSAPFLAFEVIFKGEYVVGEGGPYRQFFADTSAELQPSSSSLELTEISNACLHLLCPTPNTANKQGDAKDKFTLTPSAKTTKNLLLYEFLGLLMGCCMRTGVRLSLDLASIIWKQIVREPISLADLEELDNSVVGMLKYITGKELTATEFEAIFTETFTAMLSDTSSIELIPNGTSIPVTFDRREEYSELLLKARLNESAIQCRAVRKGISLIVPEAMLSFLTSQEIASLICGKPVVDLEMLRRHTHYGKGLTKDSDCVKYLWEVLGELSEVDKLRFIKFCWGQERLPANDEEYEDKQVRFMIKPAMRKGNSNEENALPKADTCFFNLELPNYQSKEKLKEKLLLAIYTDFVSMNADDNPAIDPRFSSNAILDDE